jgi:dTMP kinase
MTKLTPRGRFITLEGGEGAGKSTQIRHLAARLAALGIPVVATREPGGSSGAEAIRSLVLTSAERFGPLAEALLFSAARADHLERLIRPALKRGEWVICDRFADSTRAYQGAAGGLDVEIVSRLERLVVAGTKPHLTLMLDIPADLGLARAALRRGEGGVDRFEGEGHTFHDRLRTAFLAIAKAEPERCAVIDASQPEEAVAAEIWSVVQVRLLQVGHGVRAAEAQHGEG